MLILTLKIGIERLPMSDNNTPAMSAVIVTPDRYETIRKTVRHLWAFVEAPGAKLTGGDARAGCKCVR
jgi:hypothetical protein